MALIFLTKMTVERYLLEVINGTGVKTTEIEVPGYGVIKNMFHPQGIELAPYLAPEHMPSVTQFQTVVFSQAFAELRGDLGTFESPAIQIPGGSGRDLLAISQIARDKRGYNPDLGRQDRANYLAAMAGSASLIYAKAPVLPGDVIVPVVRCGGNIATELGLAGCVRIEAKRLRFKGNPDILGAGITISPKVAERLKGRHIRLLEGVIASGSTVCVVAASLANLGVQVAALDCDAVVVAPAGASFSAAARKSLGVRGVDRGVFIGGGLNSNWYVVYQKNDPLLALLDKDAPSFVGEQVLGDGGDLTSNTRPPGDVVFHHSYEPAALHQDPSRPNLGPGFFN